jgi:hypothetical protein
MGLACPPSADDVFNLILLEQTNAGDSGRSSFQARCGVFDRDATESEDGNVCPAGLLQRGEAGGGSSGGGYFPEHRSEDGEVGGLRFGAQDIGGCVAGGSQEEVVSSQ